MTCASGSRAGRAKASSGAVEVDDLDAHFAQAVEAGATILREPEEPGIGYLIYTAEDLEGHRWMFGQRLDG